MKLRLLVVFLLLSLASIRAYSQNTQAYDPFAREKAARDFAFMIEDGSTHQPLANTSVDIELTGSDGVVSSVQQPTDADGKVTVSLVPAVKYSLTIHVDGYEDLAQNWSGSDSLEFSLHPNPLAAKQTPQAGQPSPFDMGNADQAPTPAPAPDIKATIHTVLVQLFFALLPVAAFFLLREIAVRAVLFFMMRRGSPKPASAPAEEPGPVPAATPTFLEMNTLNGVLLNGSAESRLERAETTSRRKLHILLLSLVVQACGLAAALALIAWLAPKALAEGMPEIGIGAGVLLGVDVILAFYAWTTWLQGARLVELLSVVSTAVTIAITVEALRDKVPALIVLPAVLQIAYLVQQFRGLRLGAQRDGNRKLVILRVFGSDKNTAFTFGKLMERWRFVGSFLTIVDPSYIRYKFSVMQKGNLGSSLGATLTFGTLAALLDQAVRYVPAMFPQMIPAAWAALPQADLQARVRSVAYLALAVVATGPMLLYVWRHFMKSPAQAIAGVNRMERATLSLESDFHGSPFFCFDDVWQPAVRKMLSVADVVLMDLRGFSEQRQGCAYELGELVDHYPVDRLLFLVDASTPRELLKRLILERWEKMRADSPNRQIAEPIIQLYQTANQAASDIHHIAALLSANLDGSLRPHAQLMYWEQRLAGPVTSSAEPAA